VFLHHRHMKYMFTFSITWRTLREAKFREKEHLQAFIAGRVNLYYITSALTWRRRTYSDISLNSTWERLIRNIFNQEL
jgi:hypothetical protein